MAGWLCAFLTHDHSSNNQELPICDQQLNVHIKIYCVSQQGINKFILWYCKFLCMHATALHQLFEVLCVTTNHFKFYEIALCDILETLASVFVLGHRLITHDTIFCMNVKS